MICSSGFSARPKVCLNMIVKDESAVIERCLNSVKPLIDYWVIVDTGSTDNTREIIRRCMQDIPGELHESSWVNFEHNRNEALQLAKSKADYLLFIDADEKLNYSEKFTKPVWDKDAYIATVHETSGLNYQRILLVNSDQNWKWEGVIHEVIASPTAKTFELLQDIVNYSNTKEGARSKDPRKYLNDAKLLEQALAQEPTHARYTFFLAQSYANAGEYALALENYQKRAALRGEESEVFWSLYCVARVKKVLKEPQESIEKSFWEACRHSPTRGEPFFELINIQLANQNYALAYILSKHAVSLPIPQGVAFVDENMYRLTLPIQFTDCAFLMKQYDEARQMLEKLLALAHLTPSDRERLARNLTLLKTAH